MPAPPYTIETRDSWLVARFPEPWMVLSWAVVNGGYQRTQSVVWLYLRLHEIQHVADPIAWMHGRMHAGKLAGAVGFMTSRRALAWVEDTAQDGDAHAWAIATVGLSNAIHIAQPRVPPAAMPANCTINLLVATNIPLTPEAALEALSLIAEGKTAAMLEAGPHTGTGTDYMAIAWPCTGTPERYAGKHTPQGAAIGRAAYRTVAKGIADWEQEYRP
jgi:adenosylcobinamide amidohydrolase